MNSNDSRLSAQDARAALDQAAAVKVTSERDIRILSRVPVGVGIAMGLVLVLIKMAGDNIVVFWIGMAVYLMAILAFVFYNGRARSAPRGYGVRYGLGVAGTSLVYGIGVYLVSGLSASWPVTLGMAVLTMVPAAAAAYSIATLVKK